MLRYCKKCVMPDTKPDLYFDEEGICSACRFYDDRGVKLIGPEENKN